MSTADSKLDVGFWEKLSDKFGAFTEGIVGFLGRIFGSSNERYIRSLGYIKARDVKAPPTVVPGSILAQVNALEEKMTR